MKPLVGVIHLPPLASSPRGTANFDAVLTAALDDARALAEGGVDGLMVENFGDAPFHRGTRDDPVPPDVPAALACAARAVREATGLPVGINCLRNDGIAAMGAAAVAGARWVRINVFAGAAMTDQGQIDAEAARVLAYRKRLGTTTAVLADVHVKHAVPLAPQPIGDAARDLAARSGAAAVVVSGRATGQPPDAALLAEVKASVGEFDVWLGSGLDLDNARVLWPLCDGAIVGTSIKVGGDVHAPVDAARVRALRAACAN